MAKLECGHKEKGLKMSRINAENYFDYAEAIHCFMVLNHGGQGSELYKMLSKSEFRPGVLWSEAICELENSVYSEITEENVEELFAELTQFMESKI